ncbi:hypothetical protein M422DRAFT_276687 [Sphaerobolus stellatus SS14]|uniref:Unplaced genomic scaffold SPHSTscaffold_846, whole genome shotgun sequence n=1 Tax=Sphaerobolus stellatus (strain SS14) TaxID=990650 RepID=A0A0C9TLU7_SPHS4|nr:hypothetical protein M422DRAFT_276687 [Sphaerobolus stellatus SS14]
MSASAAKPDESLHQYSARGIDSKEYVEERKKTHKLVEALRQNSYTQNPQDPTRVTEIQEIMIVQGDWLKKHVKKLLDSSIILPIHHKDVKCINPIVLAPKDPKNCHYSTQHLRILTNAACSEAGVPLPHPTDPLDCTLVPVPPPYEPGWWLCNNFCALNAVTEVPMFPTGDLMA